MENSLRLIGHLRAPAFCLLYCGICVLAGCSSVRVRVDARAATEEDLRQRLAGPAYVIRGPEQVEGTLAFQEFANTFSYALEMRRPDLTRVDTAEPADFAILLHVFVADLGGGVISHPVYGSRYGRVYGPYGPGYYHSYGIVGTEIRSVHYGYDHVLSATAYIQDPAGPLGRRVLWEGTAGSVGDRQEISAAMPYLALGLTTFFGTSTAGREVVKFSRRDEHVRYLQDWVQMGVRPVRWSGEESVDQARDADDPPARPPPADE
jgi:hypothetical protein